MRGRCGDPGSVFSVVGLRVVSGEQLTGEETKLKSRLTQLFSHGLKQEVNVSALFISVRVFWTRN